MVERKSQPRQPTTVGVAFGIAIGIALVSTWGVTSHLPGTNPAAIQCSSSNPRVADPNAPHGMFVLDPPVSSGQPYYADVIDYLLNNPAVCGADFSIPWNSIDAGPNATPRYNWSLLAQDIAPWQGAGKKVNLIFQTVGYGPNQSFIPPYVLSQVQTIRCGSSSVTPLFWEPTYVSLYESYIRAVVGHFQGDPAIGYMRFGLGVGGETFPLYGLQNNSECDQVLNATGFTPSNWTSYLVSMLGFEHSLGSQIQLMVSLNEIFPGISDNVSRAVAATAASLDIGIGSEGLTAGQVNYSASGSPTCGVGSCRFFEEYSGQVPLEFQTLTPSQPNGSGPTGSLTVMLPWAVGIHAQIFELHLNDWLTAFDPIYPAYAQYHVAYSDAFNAAAAVVDG